jgi:hypothetical protein
MIAKLKELYSLDIECPLEKFVPEQADYFEIMLRAMFGPENETGSESFDIRVCTPKWLQTRCDGREIITGRHMLVVNQFDLTQIQNFLHTLGRRCSGNNWSEVAQKLSRYGLWEFEDYRPATKDTRPPLTKAI